MLTHQIGAALMFPLLIFHGVDRGVPETWKWILPAMIIYAIDRIIRRFQITNVAIKLTGAESRIKAGGLLEIRLNKLFNFRAGQYAEIAVPELSKEWHPFTIASAPHESEMLFYIKQSGDWTEKLGESIEERIKGVENRPLLVRVRGPFGAPAQHTKNYKRVVLISAGVGATPFTAISKDLHHRAMVSSTSHKGIKNNVELDSALQDSTVLDRVEETIGMLYDLEDDGKPVLPVARIENAKHIAKTLDLSSIDAKDSSFSSESSYEFDSKDNCSIDIKKEVFPRRFAAPNSIRARTMSMLHTTCLSFFLLLSLVLRFTFVCIVAIWHMAEFGMMETLTQPNAYWAVAVDAILGTILSAIMLLTLSLELSYLKAKFFNRAGRCLDVFAFLPLSLITNILSLKSWASPNVQGSLTIAHFVLVLPLLFILLMYRLYRSVGSRNLLDFTQTRCTCNCGSSVPEVDYIWATRMSDHDEWLRDSLRPLSEGTELRLHRYVTREKEVKQTDSHITSTAGRPNWYSFFTTVCNSTRSNGAVGVFFCGPVTMGSSIKKVIREIEVRSHLRGAYLSALSNEQIERDFELPDKAGVVQLRRFGCNVRFVFREENF